MRRVFELTTSTLSRLKKSVLYSKSNFWVVLRSSKIMETCLKRLLVGENGSVVGPMPDNLLSQKQLKKINIVKNRFDIQKNPTMLPQFFLQLVDNHGDSLQQMALLAYLKNEKHGKPLLEAVTTAQVLHSVYKHISKDDEIEAARHEAVMKISDYVKKHPHARPQELKGKVDEEIAIFKMKIQHL